jgi:hypothetical protein
LIPGTPDVRNGPDLPDSLGCAALIDSMTLAVLPELFHDRFIIMRNGRIKERIG